MRKLADWAARISSTLAAPSSPDGPRMTGYPLARSSR